MKKIIFILILIHIFFLLMAATNFTFFNMFKSIGRYQWTFFNINFHSGWGKVYVSAYSVQQIVAYLISYGLGVYLFKVYSRKNYFFTGLTGRILCGLGFLSFLFEATHWFVNHQFSVIFSIPVGVGLLWVLIFLIQFTKLRR